MPYTTTYSLSSATGASSCRTKKKRVSAQLSRLLGSRSRVSSEGGAQYSRRGFSDDAGIGARSCNNNISNAAAWMWHSRGVGDAAVLPTRQRRVLVQHGSNNDARSSIKLQPSRFKAEAANMLRSGPADDQWQTAYQNYVSHYNQSQASHDTLASKHEEHLASTFLYDEFELSCLQDMLERSEIAQLGAVSHDMVPNPPGTISSSKSSPSHQIKPFYAIEKLFKRLYNTSIRKSNAAINSGSSAAGLGNEQHVIHHHHHHYHHYNCVLDLSANHQPAPAPVPTTDHRHDGFVRRRRASSESCSEAQRRSNNIIDLDLVDDSFHAEAHDHRPRSWFTADINSAAGRPVSGGPKVLVRKESNVTLFTSSFPSEIRDKLREKTCKVGNL